MSKKKTDKQIGCRIENECIKLILPIELKDKLIKVMNSEHPTGSVKIDVSIGKIKCSLTGFLQRIRSSEGVSVVFPKTEVEVRVNVRGEYGNSK